MRLKSNLVQYLKEYGDKSFRETPFSEVDALVLAQLSYLKMKDIVPGFGKGSAVSWQEMAQHPRAEQMFADPLYGKQHRRIFFLVASSRRYRQPAIKNGLMRRRRDSLQLSPSCLAGRVSMSLSGEQMRLLWGGKRTST